MVIFGNIIPLIPFEQLCPIWNTLLNEIDICNIHEIDGKIFNIEKRNECVLAEARNYDFYNNCTNCFDLTYGFFFLKEHKYTGNGFKVRLSQLKLELSIHYTKKHK